MTKYDPDKIYLTTQVLAVMALLAVLPLGLLSALLAGLLVYNIVVFGAKGLGRLGVLPDAAKMLLLLFVFVVVSALFIMIGVMFASFVSEEPESIVSLIKHMAEVVNTARKSLPGWVQDYLPSNIEGWQMQAHEWLLSNARTISAVGRGAGLFIVHLVFGMIIGGLAAMHSVDAESRAPLTRALDDRGRGLSLAFRRIVFSQFRISALNTCLTGIFLGIVMPALGYNLPLVKTMIVVTFIVGLLPIIGNIISNTIIVLIALGVSPGAAVGALVFLILIHKLEYFINARIIGSRISAHAWEILTAMLVMEAAFGIPGLIAAPIYYAYLKDELAGKKLI